ncbi:C-type lectin domain family 4 member D isoform X3 [Anas platyrhynchos]|uniref:C-type lectin domain family 4 member D isoform X3 n=1 Tax=Anas platyrhynchos TaxID=8839 RepID=UPI000F7C1BB3|eukprot:XP_027304589.1 C-type lectin domain family 4 member D-like isoform X3 [Anas platyrhynchos]
MNQQERVGPGTAGAVASTRLCPRMLQGGTASPMDLQAKSLMSPRAVTSPQPCRGTIQSCTASWRCIKAKHSCSVVSPCTGRDLKCCSEGWRPFQESCYYFSDDQMPWDESQQNCSGMGSQLVVINTKAEQAFLYKEIQMKYRQNGINLYIGLRAQKVGQWRWADQTPYNERAAFWRRGEPSDQPSDELCVVIHYQKDIFRNWNNVPCTIHSYWICETAAETI